MIIEMLANKSEEASENTKKALGMVVFPKPLRCCHYFPGSVHTFSNYVFLEFYTKQVLLLPQLATQLSLQ